MPAEPTTTTLPGTCPPPYPTRFGWGMRLFLALLLFDIIFRSFSIMIPWGAWAEELDITIRPRRLPTRAEFAEMHAAEDSGELDPTVDDLSKVADSMWEFWRPWPEPSARLKIRTWGDGGKWTLVWVTSRLELVENVLGFNEEWPMFSPNVGRRRHITRARMTYDDGTERIVRSRGDPEDLTHYSHWFEEKILDHELKIREGRNRALDSWGFCHLLRHRHATNDAGAALAKIHLFVVRYDLPPPTADAREWLADQNGPPSNQVYADFYVFDAKTNKGECLLDSYP